MSRRRFVVMTAALTAPLLLRADRRPQRYPGRLAAMAPEEVRRPAKWAG